MDGCINFFPTFSNQVKQSTAGNFEANCQKVLLHVQITALLFIYIYHRHTKVCSSFGNYMTENVCDCAYTSLLIP